MNPLDDLSQLATKYGTDKWNWHHYTPHYHKIFENRRNYVVKVLEIGIGDSSMKNPSGEPYKPGASLRMWEEYFPNALIYGIDNNMSSLIYEGRIWSNYCDQSQEHQLRYLMSMMGGEFDLIVDDGCHIPEIQVSTAKILVPLLAPNGIYVIEDVWPYPSTVGWSKEPFGLKLEEIPYPAKLIQCGDNPNSDDHLVIIHAPR